MSQMIFQQQQQGGAYIPPWLYMNQGRGNQQSPAEMLSLMQRSSTPQHYSPMEEMKAAVMGQAAMESLKYEFSRDDRELQNEMAQEKHDANMRALKFQEKHLEDIKEKDSKIYALEKRVREGDKVMTQGTALGEISHSAGVLDIEKADFEYQRFQEEMQTSFLDIGQKLDSFSGRWITAPSHEEVHTFSAYSSALVSALEGDSDARAAAAWPLAQAFVDKMPEKEIQESTLRRLWGGKSIAEGGFTRLKELLLDSSIRAKVSRYGTTSGRKGRELKLSDALNRLLTVRATIGISGEVGEGFDQKFDDLEKGIRDQLSKEKAALMGQ